MADIIESEAAARPRGLIKRFLDTGDGTFAEVVAVVAGDPLPVAASAAERDSAGGLFEPGACTHTYAYNASGLMVTDAATDGASTWVKTYTYNASAHLTGETPWVKQ